LQKIKDPLCTTVPNFSLNDVYNALISITKALMRNIKDCNANFD